VQLSVSARSSSLVLIRFIVLEILQFLYFYILYILYILPFWLDIAYSRPFLGSFGAYFPQIWPPIILTPKRTILAWKHVVWAIKHENRSSGSTWAQDREKKDRTGQSKKSQGGNISPIWGEAPTAPIETKICVVGHLADIITCAKFQDDIFRGYDFTGGWISHFPIDFCMGLTTVQRDCAACDVSSDDKSSC